MARWAAWLYIILTPLNPYAKGLTAMGKIKVYEDIDSVVPRLTLVAIQMIIALSVFLFLKIILFRDLPNWETNVLIIFGNIVAALASFLLLYKHQVLLKLSSLQKSNLERLVNERTRDLERANQEMGLEIAERQRIQQALAESEKRFRTIIHEAAIGMAVIDKDGRLLESNRALQRMLDYTSEKLQKMVISQITHPGDVTRNMIFFKELLEGRQRTHHLEERFIRSDGAVVWVRLSSSLVRDAAGDPLYLIAMVEDISKRRQAEEKVSNYQKQLQSLASELSLTEEREKRRLATELHDHIGQALAVSKIKLGLLQKIAASQDMAAQLREVHELIERMIKDTRSLTFKLSLPVLYELGFEAAVEWLAKDMHQEHGIHFQVEGDGWPSTMSNDVSFLIFQMVRELLFNVVKHARATMVKICIQNVDHKLQVVVADNGVGFDPTQIDPQNNINGFGLFSIRERLNYFKGGLEIESEPGHGTRATMTIPLNNIHHKRKSQNLPASTTPAVVEGAI